MTLKKIQPYAFGIFTALALTLTSPAHAVDLSYLPLIGPLLNLIFPTQAPVKAPVAQPVQTQVYNPNTGTMQMVWTIPQAASAYTYVNSQMAQNARVYNVYNPVQVIQQYPVQNIPVNLPNPNQQYSWNYNVPTQTYQNSIPTPPYQAPPQENNTPSYNTVPFTPTIPSSSESVIIPSASTDKKDNGTYKWPVTTNSEGTTNYVTSVFGPRDRDNFIAGCSDGTAPPAHCGIQQHNGVDIKAAVGTPLQSMTSGKVVAIDPYCSNPDIKLAVNKDPTSVKPREGCSISVLNDKGELISYSHLSDIGGLKVGQEVNAGDTIGKTGNSGASFGAHLDLSICQVTQAQVDAALKAKKDLDSCSGIGGKKINPLDKLDPEDPRTKDARAKEEINKTYLACKKSAGKDFKAIQKCRDVFKSQFNKAPSKDTTKKETTPEVQKMGPLEGDLNFKRL